MEVWVDIHEKCVEIEDYVEAGARLLLEEDSLPKDRLVQSQRLLQYHQYIQEAKRIIDCIPMPPPALSASDLASQLHLLDEHPTLRPFDNISQERIGSTSIPIRFTDKEEYGACVDLHPFHIEYLSLTRVALQPKISYYQYLHQFHRFDDDLSTKSMDYLTYLKGLHSYLLQFKLSSNPLLDPEEYHQTCLQAFQSWTQSIPDFSTTSLMNWSSLYHYTYPPIPSVDHIDWDQVYATQQLIPLGLGCLRSIAIACSLPMGGNAAQLAERILYHKRGLVKPKRRRKPKVDVAQVAWLEFQIHFLCKALQPEIRRAREQLERRMGLSGKELEVREGEVRVERVEEEKKTAFITGEDGELIPKWKVKRLGLDKSFRCEICGDKLYRGKINFDQHFFEARHIHHLKQLGIEPSVEFDQVTQVEDALRLWNRIAGVGKAVVGVDEEVEDEDGHVYLKRVYDDLVQQGILQKPHSSSIKSSSSSSS